MLQADEHPDAVIDVDDEVADFEVAKIGEKRFRRRAAPLGRAALLFEDVRLRKNLQAGVGETEAARQAADGDEHGGVPRVFGALHGDREDVVFLQQLDRPLGASRGGRHEQHRLALVSQATNLGHPIRHAASQLDRGLAADRPRRKGLGNAGFGIWDSGFAGIGE